MFTKATAMVLTAGLVFSTVPVSESQAAKKPKLSTTKVTVRVNGTKKITIKNAKKINCKMDAKSKKRVKITKKSAKALVLKGVKAGSAKIKVTLKNGKKKVTKTIRVTVKAVKAPETTKAPVVSNAPATTNTPAASNAPSVSNAPTQTPEASKAPEESSAPTQTPEASKAPEESSAPSVAPSSVPSESPETLEALVIEGEDLGESADFTYVPNGFAKWASVGIFEIDKSKLTEGSKVVLTYSAVEGEKDVTDTQLFNVALKNGDKWNSEAVCDLYDQKGGKIEIEITADRLTKINSGEKLYMHVSTSTAGFKGTFTYQGVKAGDDSLVSALPPSKTYVESGMSQWAATAKVSLPADIDFNKYETCRIEFQASDMDFEFHGILGHKVDGKEVTDPKYGVNSAGLFEITLKNVKQTKGTDPFVVINAGQAGYTGRVRIDRLVFLPKGVKVPPVTNPPEPIEPPKTEIPEVDTPEVDTPKVDTPEVDTPEVDTSKTETSSTETGSTENPGVPEKTQPLVLEGTALGDSADFTYVPNGFAQWASMGVFEIDKTKISAGSTIVLTYTAMEGEMDVKDSQGFNVGLKTGSVYNSPAILDIYGRKGGTISIPITENDLAKVGAKDKIYMHVSTETAGFKGTFTYTSIEVGEESLVTELPPSKAYVERGMSQQAPTAKVSLPADIDFKKYSKCKIEFTASDPNFKFDGIVGHKVNGNEVTDPKWGVNSTGLFEVALNNVKAAEGTDPYVVINAVEAGYTGSVKITKITFVPVEEE